jgi:hypothetical protein
LLLPLSTSTPHRLRSATTAIAAATGKLMNEGMRAGLQQTKTAARMHTKSVTIQLSACIHVDNMIIAISYNSFSYQLSECFNQENKCIHLILSNTFKQSWKTTDFTTSHDSWQDERNSLMNFLVSVRESLSEM